jgi:hypothetical protein
MSEILRRATIDVLEERHRDELERIKADRDALRDELDAHREAIRNRVATTGGGRNPMKRYVIVGNQNYGLYFGQIEADDNEIVATKSVRMLNCQHIAKWYGRTGGITSLAAYGPCGPNAKNSRVGAAAPSVLLTGIVNVLDCTPEAISNFSKIETSEG